MFQFSLLPNLKELTAKLCGRIIFCCCCSSRGEVITHNIALVFSDYRKIAQFSGSKSKEYTERIEKHKENLNPE